MPADVVIYSTAFCGYCAMAKRLLDGQGQAFREVDVSGNGAMRRWLMQASGQRTVPQIFINGRPIGGYTELARHQRSGNLNKLLSEEPPADAAPLPGVASLPSASESSPV